MAFNDGADTSHHDPADRGADARNNAGEGADTSAEGGDRQDSASDSDRLTRLEDELRTERTARTASEERYTNLRRAFNRRDTQIRDARDRGPRRDESRDTGRGRREDRGNYDDTDDRDDRDGSGRSESSGVTVTPEAYEALVQRLDFMSFQNETQDWQKDWTEILKVMKDPSLSDEVQARREDGSLNYYATLKRAHKEVKYQRGQGGRSTPPGRVPARDETIRRRATISGTGASESDAGYSEDDIKAMSADEMVSAGLIQFDPGDPQRRLVPKVRPRKE